MIPDEIIDAAIKAFYVAQDDYSVEWQAPNVYRVLKYSEVFEGPHDVVFEGTQRECEVQESRLAMRAALSVFAAQMGIKINDFAHNDWMEVIDPDHPDCGHKGQVIRSIGPDSTVTLYTTIGTYNADQVRKVPAPKETP